MLPLPLPGGQLEQSSQCLSHQNVDTIFFININLQTLKHTTTPKKCLRSARLSYRIRNEKLDISL